MVCASFSLGQYPITYFISLIDPETRKVVSLKGQKFDINFKRSDMKSKLKMRTSFELGQEHLGQIVQAIKRVFWGAGGISGSQLKDAECGGSIMASSKESTTGTANAAESEISLKQYDVVHVNRKRKFAGQFGQLKLSASLVLNCLMTILKNGMANTKAERGDLFVLNLYK